jgi:hypothetical protein
MVVSELSSLAPSLSSRLSARMVCASFCRVLNHEKQAVERRFRSNAVRRATPECRATRYSHKTAHDGRRERHQNSLRSSTQ